MRVSAGLVLLSFSGLFLSSVESFSSDGASLTSEMNQTRPKMEKEATSPHSVADTVSKLKEAVVSNGFSVQFEIDLAANFAKKNLSAPPTVILGVCNAVHAHAMLGEDPRVLSQLPCRIAVTEKDGKTLVTWLDPKMLGEFYEGEKSAKIAGDVSDAMDAMVFQATQK